MLTMATFNYRAKDREGNNLSGTVVAPTEMVAYGILKDKNFIIISLKESRKVTFKFSFAAFKKVKPKEVVIFGRQLSVMISAGVPIVKALKVLARQTANDTFRTIISDVAGEIDGGAKLSMALSRYPRVFGSFFVHMIRSAETTGKLDEILNYLADQMEKDYDLRAKVKGAMIYPAFIMGGIILVGAAMMIFVIPQLMSVLTQGGAKLPFTTQLLISASNFLRGYWWLIIFVVGLMFLGLRFYIRTKAGRRTIDLLKLKIPVFGQIFQKTCLARFAQSLSTLIVSGVPLTRSLEIVADVIGNAIYKELILETIKEVESGNSITTVFVKSKHVPLMLSQMISVGEQSGRLDQVLDKLANFYARELENMLKNLVNLIEPIIMVLLGVAVGFLVSAIILPIYNLSSSI